METVQQNRTPDVSASDFDAQSQACAQSWRFTDDPLTQADEPIPYALRRPDEVDQEAVTSPGTDMLAGEG